MGKKWNEWIEVEGSESLRLPITVIEGKRDGKTMLISAGVHGAEYIGIETARTLASTLDPQKVKGKIVILLMANPTATYQFQRFFVPEDGKNLNRVFPGKADGTLSERIAHVITEKFQMEADYYMDLHGGDTSEHVMPFVYYNGAAGEEIEKISKWMAEATNLSVRARSFATTGAYSSACQRGLPSVLIERGGGGRYTKEEVMEYCQDVRNILVRTGILEGEEEVHTVSQREITTATYLDAPKSCLWYPNFQPGESFQKDDCLGILTDVWGESRQEILAEYDGIVLYETTILCVGEGDPLIAYGKTENA